VRVLWTHTAIQHLLAVHEHLTRDAPLYAQRTVDRLTRRSEQIATFPLSGRIVPEYGAPDIREVIERPYRIIYRVKADQIDVLAVVHRAQLLPPESPEQQESHLTTHCSGRGDRGASQFGGLARGGRWCCPTAERGRWAMMEPHEVLAISQESVL
jgi:toxin ParE1/3/4